MPVLVTAFRDFSGYLHYKDWEGNALFALRIEKGRPVRKYDLQKAIKLGPNTSTSSTSRNKVMVADGGEPPKCYWVTWEWYQDCYTLPEAPDFEFCDPPVIIDVQYLEVACPPDPDGNGGGPNYPELPPDECLGVLVFETGECIEELEEENTPCALAKKLLKNAEFKTNFKKIMDNVSGSVEKGYVFNFATNSFIEKIGAANSLDLNISSPVDGWFHNHRQNVGHYATFDMDDVGFIYQTYADSNIVSVPNFVTGVATQYGTYLLKINDINAFKNFGASNFTSLAKIDAIRDRFDDEIGIGMFTLGLNQKTATELALLKVLGSSSGLILFEGNSAQTKWQAKKRELNEIVNETCN
ncbi:MAG: hypothetical protein EOP48_27115 [Sphingobacteriales bacterium]|nr:MAG: hypothetical protein EOP48_27115 [Sphingobacteriales bacterium]